MLLEGPVGRGMLPPPSITYRCTVTCLSHRGNFSKIFLKIILNNFKLLRKRYMEVLKTIF